MIDMHKSYKLHKIVISLFSFQFTLAYYLPEAEYKLVPELKTEEHHLIAKAANKYYELVALNDEKT